MSPAEQAHRFRDGRSLAVDDRGEHAGDHCGREGGKKVHRVIVEPAAPLSSCTQQGIDE